MFELNIDISNRLQYKRSLKFEYTHIIRITSLNCSVFLYKIMFLFLFRFSPVLYYSFNSHFSHVFTERNNYNLLHVPPILTRDRVVVLFPPPPQERQVQHINIHIYIGKINQTEYVIFKRLASRTSRNILISRCEILRQITIYPTHVGVVSFCFADYHHHHHHFSVVLNIVLACVYVCLQLT